MHIYVGGQQQNTKLENKSTTVSIKSYNWVYKACFTSRKNIECCVTERADNALSHRLLSPWGDMGTDDFVFTRKGIQIRRVFGGWSPSVEESNYLLLSSEAACLSQSQVSLGDPGWARLRKTLRLCCMRPSVTSKGQTTNDIFGRQITMENSRWKAPRPYAAAFLWRMLWLIEVGSQQLSFTLRGWKSFCGNYILFLLICFYGDLQCISVTDNFVLAFKQYCMGHFTWVEVLTGPAPSLAPLRWAEWLPPDERRIINLCELWSLRSI